MKIIFSVSELMLFQPALNIDSSRHEDSGTVPAGMSPSPLHLQSSPVGWGQGDEARKSLPTLIS